MSVNSANNFHGVGRRKRAVARVWLRGGSGKIIINGRAHSDFFPTKTAIEAVERPLKAIDKSSMFDVKVNVNGGGWVGQAGATSVGIARAILSTDEGLRPVLRENGLLTVDSRKKERKKYGQRGARAKFQFVKR